MRKLTFLTVSAGSKLNYWEKAQSRFWNQNNDLDMLTEGFEAFQWLCKPSTHEHISWLRDIDLRVIVESEKSSEHTHGYLTRRCLKGRKECWEQLINTKLKEENPFSCPMGKGKYGCGDEKGKRRVVKTSVYQNRREYLL